jgi:hypothetical protein
VIVVEILTPGGAARGATVKLNAYLGHRGIGWILLVDPSERAVMVYRGSGDPPTPGLLTGGSLPLPPLRVPLDIAALLARDYVNIGLTSLRRRSRTDGASGARAAARPAAASASGTAQPATALERA